MSLRIISGSRRGTILTTPAGSATRPTLGRVRGSLFMILLPELRDARVLDVFAGSGVLAFEAISRGAVRATLVEDARPALAAIRANIEKLRWQDRTRVVAREALAVLREPAPPDGEPYDVIFLDPPYGRGLCHQALERLGEHALAWLDAEGVIAAQHGRQDALGEAYGPLVQTRRQEYSETHITFYRLHS